MVALYREASVVGDLAKAIDAFDYPKGKLDIKLVVEQRDVETLGRIVELRLPARYEVVVAPSGKPQTKPRALNIALSSARGDLVVVYDAEDDPGPRPIAPCRVTFRRRQRSGLSPGSSRDPEPRRIVAVQALRDRVRNTVRRYKSRLVRSQFANSPGRQLQLLSRSVLGRGGGVGRVERHRGCGPWNSPVALRLQGESAGFGHLGGSSLRVRKLVPAASAMAKRLDADFDRSFEAADLFLARPWTPTSGRRDDIDCWRHFWVSVLASCSRLERFGVH